MNRQKFRFYNKTDDFQYNPKKEILTFYQICQFKNPYNNKYGTRKVIFNEQGEIIKTYEKEYSQDRINTFMKRHRQNKYCVYPVSDIQIVDLPGPSYILEAKSELLNNDHEEYGFAPV